MTGIPNSSRSAVPRCTTTASGDLAEHPLPAGLPRWDELIDWMGTQRQRYADVFRAIESGDATLFASSVPTILSSAAVRTRLPGSRGTIHVLSAIGLSKDSRCSLERK